MKLDIGAGLTPKPGYKTVDVVPEMHPDFCAPMWEIPLPDNSVDEIFTTHALEHVAKNKVVPTLREWYRILKPGAKAEIQVPDLEWCCRNWLEHLTNDWHMDTLFGNQEHEGEFHKTGFTANLMYQYLQQAGFVQDQVGELWSHNQRTLYFIVHKPVG